MHILFSIRLFPLLSEAGETPRPEHYSRTVFCSAILLVLKLKVITDLIDPVVECRPDFNFASGLFSNKSLGNVHSFRWASLSGGATFIIFAILFLFRFASAGMNCDYN
ncbi:hypothetical protein CDAR_39551 [Caerostris darwini]|uniref:Uncharacterized protein n=1 Tax=Caerostris darwini TaxID=1538125 RepID=A0AAV4U6C1_9ARAC|nr:hypothetical protein CDAR_39551 [Caerostris darwini]